MDVRLALPIVLLAVAVSLTGAVDSALGPIGGFALNPSDGSLAAVTLAGSLGGSPAFTWGEPPPHTHSFALVAEDLDAGEEGQVFWAIWGVPADQREIEPYLPRVAKTSGGFSQAIAPDGRPGYLTPSLVDLMGHRIRFTLFALRTPLGHPSGTPSSEILVSASSSAGSFATWRAGGGWTR